MGIVYDIQKCCYHDGPGIRTTVFLKGCNLRCLWCHNPESFSLAPQLKYTNENCSFCGMCAHVCPQAAHEVLPKKHIVHFSKCITCGQCTEHCKNSALSIIGRDMNTKEVIKSILLDKAYYETSGGGVTISGGEATYQQEFLYELLIEIKAHNLHTCLETNGCMPQAYLMKILPFVDLFLLDYKATDPDLLKKYTRADKNEWMKTITCLQAEKKPVILRMPIIPGINDNREHFQAACKLLQDYPVIQSIEIMPYHSLGSSKWEQIGLTYPLHDIKEPSEDQKKRWKSYTPSL